MKHVLFTWTAGLTKLKTFFRVLEPCCYCDFKKMEALKGSKFGRAYLTGIAEDQDMRSLIMCKCVDLGGRRIIKKKIKSRKCSVIENVPAKMTVHILLNTWSISQVREA